MIFHQRAYTLFARQSQHLTLFQGTIFFTDDFVFLYHALTPQDFPETS